MHIHAKLYPNATHGSLSSLTPSRYFNTPEFLKVVIGKQLNLYYSPLWHWLLCWIRVSVCTMHILGSTAISSDTAGLLAPLAWGPLAAMKGWMLIYYGKWEHLWLISVCSSSIMPGAHFLTWTYHFQVDRHISELYLQPDMMLHASLCFKPCCDSS